MCLSQFVGGPVEGFSPSTMWTRGIELRLLGKGHIHLRHPAGLFLCYFLQVQAGLNVAKNDLELLILEPPGLKVCTATPGWCGIGVEPGAWCVPGKHRALEWRGLLLSLWTGISLEHVTISHSLHPLMLWVAQRRDLWAFSYKSFCGCLFSFLLDIHYSSFWDTRQAYTRGGQLDGFPRCLHKLYP